METDGHKIVVTWFLNHACTSNTELGIISNVCQRWRDIAISSVVSEAIAMTQYDEDGDADNMSVELESGEGTPPPQSTTNGKPSSLIRQLMITDMARELITRKQYEQSKITNSTTSSQNNNNQHHVMHQQKQNTTQGNNFCLAWFAPSGIQTISVSLDDDDDDEYEAEQDNIGTERGRTVSINANSCKRVTCCPEWRGYRHATEVLIPFGYATDFVRSVFDATLELAFGNDISANSVTLSEKTKPLSHQYNPTFAVRGATLARPEGFCLCLDNDYIEHANSSHFQKPSHATYHQVPSCIDGWMNDYDTDNQWPLLKNVGLSPIQRKRKQSILSKSLLPRVVLSTRRKYPLLHRFAETDAHENESEQLPLPWEKRQRAVQFLNADKSQAIKLITPQFECGPTSGPVTVFLIGITTEDGCFFSGRSSRFELGHLYPLSSRDMQIDMSPIAIATGRNDTNVDANDCVGDGRRSSTAGSTNEQEMSDDEVSGSTDDSDKSIHCLCEFDSGDPFNPKDISVEDPSEECIHHGATGPGLWHCYTAVFDGENSIIRVDGCTEPKRTREHYGLTASDDEEESGAEVNSGRFVGSGFLDGLSIGSDHQFDMSLCYGEIEGEAGQGSIAELAVFKGRMSDCDIDKLEKYLMKKHGILSVQEKREFIAKENETRMKPINIECHIQEDEWRRQAHALITQRRPWNLDGMSVPLRVAANHHSVAWRRTNDITGQPVRITRIGAKNSNGSSDW